MKETRQTGPLHTAVSLLQFLFPMRAYDDYLNELATFPAGTTGRAVADQLRENGLRFIPNFIDHDLKHIVLEYDMNIADEILMQAYLLGNGNRSIICLLILGLAVFRPDLWPEIPVHYRRGQEGSDICGIRLKDCAHIPLSIIQEKHATQKA